MAPAVTLHAGALALPDEAQLPPALIGVIHRLAQPIGAASFQSLHCDPPQSVALVALAFEMYQRQAVPQGGWRTESGSKC